MSNGKCSREYLIHQISKRSNLAIVARSSRSMMKQALEAEFGVDPAYDLKISSQLVLSSCFREYCYGTALAIDRFGLAEFTEILTYYDRLVTTHPDLQLLRFEIADVQPILEQVGTSIRSYIYCRG